MLSPLRTRGSVSVLLTLALATSGIACSDSKPPPENARTSDTASAAAPSASTSAPAPSASQAAEPAPAMTSVMAAVRPEMMHAGFLDVRALRDRGWFKLIENLPADVGEPIHELVRTCGTAPWTAFDQLAWSGATDKAFVLVAKLAVPPDAVMTCIKNVAGRATDVSIGADKGVRVGPFSIVMHGGMLVAGRGKPFEEVLANVPAGASPLLEKVTAGPDQALRIAFDGAALPGAPMKDLGVTLSTSAARFALDVTVNAPSEAAAKDMEAKAKGALDQLAHLGKDVPQLPPIQVTREGAALHVRLEKAGGAEEQVALLGTISAVSVYGVRRYLQSAKSSEAKNTVSAIARGVVAYAERENVDAKGKLLPHQCPPNAPAVPKDVPKGNKYMSKDADWGGTWRDLRFMMSEPQYYRYRVESAPNRKKCTVIAEGDLDGNGKLSKFSLEVVVDPKDGAKISPDLKVENEFE